ncbi:MAG TPA: hypothetical protein VNH22_06155 [Blastocatellia bacterium]|nr:hypothetical protein [Blastocatellia bacterium]
MLDSYTIIPKTDEDRFDVGDLISKVEGLPTAVRLPGTLYSLQRQSPESVYVIGSNEDQARRIREWTSAGNTLERYWGSVAHLEIAPESVLVQQAAPEGVVQQVSALLLPFLKRQPFRIFSEYAEETAAFAPSPERLFE